MDSGGWFGGGSRLVELAPPEPVLGGPGMGVGMVWGVISPGSLGDGGTWGSGGFAAVGGCARAKGVASSCMG